MASQVGNGILRAVLSAADAMGLTDRELLAQFNEGNQAAFAAIVKRHTGMVLGVCRRVVPTVQDAEDACQATFLVLARKAKTGKWQSSVANWLYTTARRIASTANRAAAQRIKREMRTAAPAPDCVLDQMTVREAFAVLDDELDKLPPIYREPLVLCYLQGLTRDEAAARLAIPAATLKGQLDRGRKRLANALTKRGIDIGAALMAVAVTRSAGASPQLIQSILSAVGGAPSASVAALAQGVGVNGVMLKAELLALAAVIATATGFGLSSLLIAAGTQKPAIERPQQPEPSAAVKADPQKPMARVDRFGDPLPAEALTRFGTVRFRQGILTHAIRYSPDGKTIAIAGWGRSLGLWDVDNQKELFQFRLDGGEPGQFPISYSIAFSPDGKLLAEAVIQGDVRIWDTRTGKLARALKGHIGYARAVVFAAGGKTVISGGDDSKIRFWDVETGQETATLDQHTDSVRSLAVSSDGKLFASGSADKTIRIWNVNNRTLIRVLQFPPVPANMAAPTTLSFLSFSPDGKQLASTGSKQCVIWDTATGEQLHKLHDEQTAVLKVDYAPNGKWFAAGYMDGTIRLYDSATWKEMRRWDTQSFDLRDVVFSNDSKTIVSNSRHEYGIRFWDVETGKNKNRDDVHRSIVEELRLSPDGKSLLGLEREWRVIRWDPATAKPEESIFFPSDASNRSHTRATLSSDGAFLAWGSTSDKTIRVMDLKTRKDACEPLKLDEIGSRVNAVDPPDAWMSFSPNGKVLAVGNKSRIYLWQWKTERNPKRLEDSGNLSYQSSFTSDSKEFFVGDLQAPKMHVWDVATGEKKSSIPIESRFERLAFSPDGKWAVCTSPATGGHIQVIDISKQKVAREIVADRESSFILAFSPDGHVLAFGEDDSRCYASDVKLIEFATGQTIATFKGHHSGVSAFQFTPDGRTLFSGSCDTTILKWDATARHSKGPSTPNLAAAWEALAQEASKAYPAGWDLVDAPNEALALLRQKIVPAKKLDAKEVRAMVDGLDSAKFQDRQKASALLKSLGDSVEPLLRQMVEAEKRPEVKQRLQALIDELSGPSFLRIQRAMQVLETIGNDDARQLLRDLADGAPDSMLTKEAASVLKRMVK